jgi:hypothetical protein
MFPNSGWKTLIEEMLNAASTKLCNVCGDIGESVRTEASKGLKISLYSQEK